MYGAFFTFFLGLSLALAAPSWAAKPTPALKDCRALFKSLLHLAEEFSDLGADEGEEPTIGFVRELAGRHGGKRHVIQRLPGKPWGTLYQETVNAPQGDPRNFIELLGVEGAKFFGFEMLSETEMTVPDAAEVNGAIAKLNPVLAAQGLAPIPIRLYEQSGGKIVEYLRQWADGNLALNARLGTHRIHDLSIHSGVIFLPPEVAAHSRYQTSELIRFADAAQEKVLELAARKGGLDADEKALLTWYKSYLLLSPTNLVDLGTAHLMAGYLSRNLPGSENGIPRASDGFKAAMDVLNFSFQDLGATPGSAKNTVLLAALTSMDPGIQPSASSPDKVQRFQAAFGKILADPALQLEFEVFVESYVDKRAAESAQFSKAPPLTSDAACAQAVERLQAIRKAAQQLAAEAPK